jgi:hypothetical protein
VVDYSKAPAVASSDRPIRLTTGLTAMHTLQGCLDILWPEVEFQNSYLS